MNDRIAIYREDGIADVRLNRPEKMNALDRGMFAALVETAQQLEGDPVGGPVAMRLGVGGCWSTVGRTLLG